MVVGQKVAIGRVHAGKTVTIHVTDTELAIACDDGTRHRPAHHRPASPQPQSQPAAQERSGHRRRWRGRDVDGMLTDLSYHPTEVT
ncbi:hypothetical protein ACFXA2_25535 [Micromonospora chalcea]